MSIDKAITYLKKKAPKGEFLAYINPKEAAMLKKAGGSGELVNGIPSYRSKRGMESKARSRSYSSPSKSSSPSPRGPQELGTSTRTVNRITAPPPTTRRVGGMYICILCFLQLRNWTVYDPRANMCSMETIC